MMTIGEKSCMLSGGFVIMQAICEMRKLYFILRDKKKRKKKVILI